VVGALKCVVRSEDNGFVSVRPLIMVADAEIGGAALILGKYYVTIQAVEGICIAHHASWLVDNREVISKENLCPVMDLVNFTITFKDLFNGA
jgi:hypothetical protein